MRALGIALVGLLSPALHADVNSCVASSGDTATDKEIAATICADAPLVRVVMVSQQKGAALLALDQEAIDELRKPSGTDSAKGIAGAVMAVLEDDTDRKLTVKFYSYQRSMLMLKGTEGATTGPPAILATKAGKKAPIMITRSK